eukprot:2052656-Rhodomonas_salina.2
MHLLYYVRSLLLPTNTCAPHPLGYSRSIQKDLTYIAQDQKVIQDLQVRVTYLLRTARYHAPVSATPSPRAGLRPGVLTWGTGTGVQDETERMRNEIEEGRRTARVFQSRRCG